MAQPSDYVFLSATVASNNDKCARRSGGARFALDADRMDTRWTAFDCDILAFKDETFRPGPAATEFK